MTLLSETDLDFVDKVVEALCSGLILEQHREEILINEYAKTYLIIKFKPNRIEFIKKQNTIREVVSVFYTLNWFNCTSGLCPGVLFYAISTQLLFYFSINAEKIES